MSMTFLSRRPLAAALPLALAALLASCASTHGLETSTQPHDADQLAAQQSLSDFQQGSAGFPQQEWWKALGDPQLDALVDEALKSNPNLDLAQARLRKAQAEAGLAEAETKPTLGVNGQYAVAQLPKPLVGEDMGGQLLHNPVGYLQFDWPLDVWGGHRAAYQAALGQARAQEIESQAVRLSLAANIARAYIGLAEAFDAQDVAQRELDRATHLQQLSRQRFDAGIDSQLQERNADAAIASAQAQQVAATQQIASARTALAAMLGAGPDRGNAIARPQLLAVPAPGLPSTVPSELLGHRPDVVAARWNVYAANRNIAAAKAQFKPSINLSAMAGLVGTNFSDVFKGESFFGFGGPAISMPLFDGGRLRNNLAVKDADYDVAVASYNQALADALHEVVDAMQQMRSLDAQAQSLAQARDAADAAYKLADTRYKAGIGTQLDVLSTERPLLQLDQQLAGIRAQRYQAAVDLDRALGGGLSFDAPPSDAGK